MFDEGDNRSSKPKKDWKYLEWHDDGGRRYQKEKGDWKKPEKLQ
jgi:hypothetical protein